MQRSPNGKQNEAARNLRMRRMAFSLIELTVVIAIIGLLVALALPAVTNVRTTARKTRCLGNLRNISFAMTQYDQFHRRLPASGYYYDPPRGGGGGPHHSWAVSLLPFIEQRSLYNRWDLDKIYTDPVNAPLARIHIPVYVCPLDITRSDEQLGDLSYAVNGGWGFTIRTRKKVGDCPIDRRGRRLDLNGDGQACTGDSALDDKDRDLFKKLGLFFLENWKVGGTVRHHSLDDVHDGLSQTFLVTENVRTGYRPDDETANYANPNPYRCAFYIGNPCPNGSCPPGGSIDYSLSNSGENKINSALMQPEGNSPIPNSFHPGGVNMSYCDGHTSFLSESVDGAVYAALASPQGVLLMETALRQEAVSTRTE